MTMIAANYSTAGDESHVDDDRIVDGGGGGEDYMMDMSSGSGTSIVGDGVRWLVKHSKGSALHSI